MGAVGTVGGGIVATGGAMACPLTLVSCGAAALGGGLSVLSYNQGKEGLSVLLSNYQYTEGQRVLNSFSLNSYPGEANPLGAAAIGVAKNLGIAAAGKYLPGFLLNAEDKLLTKTGVAKSSPAVGDTRSLAVGGERLAILPRTDVATVNKNQDDLVSTRATGNGFSDSLISKYEKGGTDLVVGIKPIIKLDMNNFTADEIAWIDHKYRIAEIRILSGKEVSEVGANVEYNYYLSQKFLRDKLAPDSSVSSIRVNQLIPGMNVDEYVSRQFGGMQVFENQNIAPAKANQIMGVFEYNAVKDLPAGTKINGFYIEGLNRK